MLGLTESIERIYVGWVELYRFAESRSAFSRVAISSQPNAFIG